MTEHEIIILVLAFLFGVSLRQLFKYFISNNSKKIEAEKEIVEKEFAESQIKSLQKMLRSARSADATPLVEQIELLIKNIQENPAYSTKEIFLFHYMIIILSAIEHHSGRNSNTD